MMVAHLEAERTNDAVTSRLTQADEQPATARRWHRVSRTTERSPKRAERAVPAGSVRAADVAEWLEAVDRAVELEARWYSSKRAAVRAWAREVARHVDGPSMTSIYTNAQALRATGRRSATTMKQFRRWAEAHGLLAEVAPGRRGTYAPASTNAMRDKAGNVITGADGAPVMMNDASVRVLCVPAALRRQTSQGANVPPGPRQGSSSYYLKESITCARENAGVFHRFDPIRDLHTEAERLAALLPGDEPLPANRRRAWWSPNVTKGKDKRIAVATARLLAEKAPVLRGAWDTVIGWALRPYVRAGWTASDVLWALDHRPDGNPWTHTTKVHHVLGWLRHRLAYWLDPEGTPLRSPRQERAAEHEQALARRAAEVAARSSAPVMAEADRLAAMIRTQRVLLALARTSGERARITAHIDELEAARDALSAQDGTNPKETR